MQELQARTLTEGLIFGEGPRWRDGRLFVSDMHGERIVAIDPLGCLDGERVLVVQGSVAKGWFEGGTAVIDALVIGSLDEDRPAAQETKKRSGKS